MRGRKIVADARACRSRLGAPADGDGGYLTRGRGVSRSGQAVPDTRQGE